MNEYEYINDTIAREVAYAEGFDAGKQAAAEEMIEDLVHTQTSPRKKAISAEYVSLYA